MTKNRFEHDIFVRRPMAEIRAEEEPFAEMSALRTLAFRTEAS